MKRLGWVAVLVLLSACGPSIPGVNLKTISLLSREDMNGDRPLCVDFVVLYDKELLRKFHEMTANQYFRSVDQLRRDNMSMMDVWRWEMVPGQFLGNYRPVFKNSKAWGALFFADYQSAGEHRFDVGPAPHVCVILGKETIESLMPRDELKTTPDPQSIASYPLDQTILLNTHTPNVGTSQDDYRKLQSYDGVRGPQKVSESPQAGVQKEEKA
jgi:hypothetical protein